MRRSSWVNLALVLGVVVLFVFPLLQTSASGSKFGGTDTKATNVIARESSGYQPWFDSVFVPPSASVESALFALQAALGAGLLGYYFGVARTRKRIAAEHTAERPENVEQGG